MEGSLLGMMKNVVGQTMGANIIACTVSKSSPLQLKFQGDNDVVLDKDCLIIPDHVTGLSKGKTVYVMPSNDGNEYFVLGKG